MSRRRRCLVAALLAVVVVDVLLLLYRERLRAMYLFRRALGGDESAVGALIDMGEPANDYLLELVESDAPSECRASALLWFSMQPHPAAQQVVLNALNDEDPRIRANAVVALSTTASSYAHLVADKLADPDADVRLISVLAWRDIARDTLSFISTVRKLLIGDPEPNVRAAAARALGGLKVSDAVPELVSATEDPDPTVRAASARALGLLGAQESRQALERLLGAPTEQERRAAHEALREIEELGKKRAE